jgi:hypothetical protein
VREVDVVLQVHRPVGRGDVVLNDLRGGEARA